MSSRQSVLLPSPSQALLCRAAVLDGEAALRAWSAWRAEGCSLDQLDETAQSVLPQLYRNLSALGVADPDLGRLKDAYRRCWFENQHVLRSALHPLSQLHEAGLRTMLCKGAALIVAEGRDPGARPMGDVDIVVAPGDARRALELLVAAGYRPTGGIEPFSALRVRRGLNLVGPQTDGGGLDLHWTRLLSPERETDVFSRAHTASLLGVPTLAPCSTDSLLTILAHGTSFDPAPVRWVLDACFLLSRPVDAIDWDLLVYRARDGVIARPVATALATLRASFEVDVPPAVLRALSGARGGVVDRLLWKLHEHPLPRGQRWPYLVNEWRLTRAAPYPGGRAGGLVSFLQTRLQATSRRDLLGRIVRHEAPWV